MAAFKWTNGVAIPPKLWGSGDTAKQKGTFVIMRYLHAVSNDWQARDSLLREDGKQLPPQEKLDGYGMNATTRGAVAKYAIALGVPYDHITANMGAFNKSYKWLKEEGFFIANDLAVLPSIVLPVLEPVEPDIQSLSLCNGVSADEFTYALQEARNTVSSIQDPLVLHELRRIEAVGLFTIEGKDLAYVLHNDEWCPENARGLEGYFRVSHALCDLEYLDDGDSSACLTCTSLLPSLAALETDHRQRMIDACGALAVEKVSLFFLFWKFIIYIMYIYIR
jgi:hypothetical protein